MSTATTPLGVFEHPDAKAPETLPLDMETIREYLRLEKEKKDLNASLKVVQEKLDALDVTITGMLLGAGVDSMKVDGRLVYLAQEVFIGAADGCERADVIAALKADEDASAFVSENYNSQSLRSWVKEIAESVVTACRDAGELYTEDKVLEALPAGLRNVLRITFGKTIRTRKA